MREEQSVEETVGVCVCQRKSARVCLSTLLVTAGALMDSRRGAITNTREIKQ